MEIEGYEILGTIGVGGMGVVYLAREKRLGRTVALKVLSEKLSEEPGFRSRFLREIHVLARLKHANLIPVFEGGIQGRFPHFSMAHIQGRSLKHVLKALRAKRDRGDEWFSVQALGEAAELSVTAPSYIETVLGWIIELADALDYVHRRKVLHLDLKPSNIILSTEGRPILLDFGVAQVLSKGWGKDEFMGTPAYMAPERMLSRGKVVGRFSDAYSLAVILFELLTLELPVPGSGLVEFCRNHRNEVLRDPIAIQPRIPVELAQILRKALAKEPSVSYPDAGSLAEDLRRFLRFEPLELPGIPFPVRINRFARRWRILLLRWAGGLLLGLSLLLLFVYEAQWKSGLSKAAKETEVQAFSLLALSRKALARFDFEGCQRFLKRSEEMSQSPSLRSSIQSMKERLRLKKEGELRLLRSKVLAKEGKEINELLRHLRPVMVQDSQNQVLLRQAQALERDWKESRLILSRDPGIRVPPLIRLASDLSKGLVSQEGRLAALRQSLHELNPPLEALICVWCGGWKPWDLELRWGIQRWGMRTQVALLFLLAFDRKEPYAEWAKAKNLHLFNLENPSVQATGWLYFPLLKLEKEAQAQGLGGLLQRWAPFQRFLYFYQAAAFKWPSAVYAYGHSRLQLGLQLRLAWGMPLKEEEALPLMRVCSLLDKTRILGALVWSKACPMVPPSPALLACLRDAWESSKNIRQEQTLCLLALWDPNTAWSFFQRNGLAFGKNSKLFGIFLKLIPSSLTRAFREEVLRDPASPRLYREGVRLWQEGIRVPPLLGADFVTKGLDPKILPDALELIQRAGPQDLPLLHHLAQNPFSVIRQGARNKLKSLGGK